MPSYPSNAIPKAKPSYYTQSQWNSLSTSAKIAEVGYTVPKATPPSTTTTTSAPKKTTGVVVLSNVGSPVTDVQSGLQLQAGQGVVNIGGGTTGGGVSIPISAPTTTSAGVTSSPSGTAFTSLSQGIQYAQTPQVQQQVTQMQQPQFQEVLAPQIDLSQLKDFKVQTPDFSSVTQSIATSIPTLASPAGFLTGVTLQAQQKQQAFAQQFSSQQSTGLQKTAGAVGAFGGGVVIGIVGTGAAILDPVGTVKGIYGAVTSPYQTGTALVKKATTDPFGFTGELVGGGVATGAVLKLAKLPFSKTSLVETSSKEIPLIKTATTKKKVIPQIGEDIKFSKVIEASEIVEFRQPTSILEDIKVGGKRFIYEGEKVETTKALSEKSVVALGKQKDTLREFGLVFEKTKKPEVSAMIVQDNKIAASLQAEYKPIQLTAITGQKVTYPLLPEQQIPVKLRAVAKGTLGEEGVVSLEFKGRVTGRGQPVGTFGKAEQRILPSPEPFAAQNLQRFTTVSEGLAVSGARKSILKFPVTSEEILSAQSRRSVFGKSVTQEVSAIEFEGGRQVVRSADISDISFPKIESRPKILKKQPSIIEKRPEMSSPDTAKLLQQFEKQEVKLSQIQQKSLQESLEKQLSAKGLTKSIGKPVNIVSKEKIGAITVKSFKEVTTTPRGVSSVPFVNLKQSKTPKGYYDVPDITRPSVRITSPRQPSQTGGRIGGTRLTYPTGTGITSPTSDLGFKPSVGLQPIQIPSFSQLPTTSQILRPTQTSGTQQQPLLGQNLFQGLGLQQRQQQIPQYKLQQIQQLQQVQRTTQRQRFGIPKVPRTPQIPKTPRIPFISLPKSSKFLGVRQSGRKAKKFKPKKKYAIPFADYLSVTQTAIRTGGRATQPRITRKAGFAYLKAVQQGQVRFATVEQRRNPKRYSGYNLGL